MCKKILTIISTLSVLALPGFAAAVVPGEYVVLSASHSSNVNTPAPAPADEKSCAQHLAELLNERMTLVETTIPGDANAVEYSAAFHLSNASSRNPKAAIIVCRKGVEDPVPPEPPGDPGDPGPGDPGPGDPGPGDPGPGDPGPGDPGPGDPGPGDPGDPGPGDGGNPTKT